MNSFTLSRSQQNYLMKHRGDQVAAYKKQLDLARKRNYPGLTNVSLVKNKKPIKRKRK